jgi:hypothetical protein
LIKSLGERLPRVFFVDLNNSLAYFFDMTLATFKVELYRQYNDLPLFVSARVY